MKKLFLSTLLLALPLLASAYDIAVENEDGVTIYYNYCNDGKELEVTYEIKDRGLYSGDINIPEEVTYLTRTRKVTQIDDHAFFECKELTSVTIPKTVTLTGSSVFYGCKSLKSIILPPNLKRIEGNNFNRCSSLESITLPQELISIGAGVFFQCTALTSIEIPGKVTEIDNSAFWGCSNLTSVILPNSLTSMSGNVFEECSQLMSIVSKMTNPCTISGSCFSKDTYNNASLIVPKGTTEIYKSTAGWKNFVFIEENALSDDDNKCTTPSISYANKKLTFSCATEGVEYHYTINDADIKSAVASSIDLSATYEISVYATKSGYTNSDVATATLVWTDAVFTETTPSASSAKAIAESIPVLISAKDGNITVRGEQNGLPLTVYTADGKMLGSATVKDGQASISTNLQRGEIAIVKIGSKSVKIIM